LGWWRQFKKGVNPMPDIFFNDEEEQPSDIIAETIRNMDQQQERQAEDDAFFTDVFRDGGISEE
jgi:hypothetical protein